MSIFPALPVNGKQNAMGIIIVDDEPDFARGLARLLSGHFTDVHIEAALSGKEALRILSECKTHLMVTIYACPR